MRRINRRTQAVLWTALLALVLIAIYIIGATIPEEAYASSYLRAKLPPPVRWEDSSGAIEIPDDVLWARRGNLGNDFGVFNYGEYIKPKDSAFILENVAHARASILKYSGFSYTHAAKGGFGDCKLQRDMLN